MFFFKAKTNVTIQSISKALLEEYRKNLFDLDDSLAKVEEFI